MYILLIGLWLAVLLVIGTFVVLRIRDAIRYERRFRRHK